MITDGMINTHSFQWLETCNGSLTIQSFYRTVQVTRKRDLIYLLIRCVQKYVYKNFPFPARSELINFMLRSLEFQVQAEQQSDGKASIVSYGYEKQSTFLIHFTLSQQRKFNKQSTPYSTINIMQYRPKFTSKRLQGVGTQKITICKIICEP